MEEFIKDLNSDDEQKRIYAAEDIGYENDVAGIEPLVKRLEVEKERSVQETIFLALERIESPEVCKVATEFLGSDNAFYRNQSVNILKRRREQSLPYLKESIKSPNQDIRKFTIDALSGFETREEAGIYEKALEDEDVNIVITAVEYLGQHRITQSKDKVEDILKKTDVSMLAGSCLEALSKIGDESSWAVIIEKYPSIKDVPSYLLEIWLSCLGHLASRDCLRFFEDFFTLDIVAGLYDKELVDALVVFHDRHKFKELPLPLFTHLRKLMDSGNLHRVCMAQLNAMLVSFREQAEIGELLKSLINSDERMDRLGVVEGLIHCGNGVASEWLQERLTKEKDPEIMEVMQEYLQKKKGKA